MCNQLLPQSSRIRGRKEVTSTEMLVPRKGRGSIEERKDSTDVETLTD